MNLGLSTGPLVHTIFWLLLYVLKSRLLVFLRLMFCTNGSRIQRLSTIFNIFALKLKVRIFHPNLKICFIVFFTIVWFVAHIVSNHYYLSYIMIRCNTMVDIHRPSDSGSRDPDTGAFIQCVDGRDPMIHKLWCHRTDRLCCEVHPTAHIETPAGTTEFFFTEYLSANRRINRIIGEISINNSIQFIRLLEIWGSGLSCISNYRASEATRGWCSTGSTNYTGIWGKSFTN